MPSGHCVPLQSGEMQNDAFSACERKKDEKLLAAGICHKRGSLRKIVTRSDGSQTWLSLSLPFAKSLQPSRRPARDSNRRTRNWNKSYKQDKLISTVSEMFLTLGLVVRCRG
eukprot:s3319_g3.t1